MYGEYISMQIVLTDCRADGVNWRKYRLRRNSRRSSTILKISEAKSSILSLTFLEIKQFFSTISDSVEKKRHVSNFFEKNGVGDGILIPSQTPKSIEPILTAILEN